MERKKLKQEYFMMFVFLSVNLIILTSGIVLCALNKNSISVSANRTLENFFFYGLIALFSIAEFFCAKRFIEYCKDYKAVKNEQFEEITGKIIKFAKNQHVDTGEQINCIPIIQICGSDKIIKLSVNSVKLRIGQLHTFIYLKHTKIGAVKQTIE